MSLIPYGKQWLDDEDIAAVVNVLRGDWLTTGPHVEQFECKLAAAAGAAHAVAVSSGTAALHAAMHALGVGKGDEVIVPALTFAATANCVVYQGGTPVFADVEADTLLIDAQSVESKITARTKGIIAVDYAGQPCDYDALWAIARKHDLFLVADACHSLGGEYKKRPVGSLAALSIFSFHPVKHIAAGEGGAITTDDHRLAERMHRFRNHGITSDHHQRQQTSSWFYEISELGFNYRLTDFQCALATSQLGKLDRWLQRRREIARCYDREFSGLAGLRPLGKRVNVQHAYHLYVVQLDRPLQRRWVFSQLRSRGIGVNVHYIPVHLHPFYRRQFGTGPGQCPNAEAAYDRILSLPMFPKMTANNVQHVIEALPAVLAEFAAEAGAA